MPDQAITNQPSVSPMPNLDSSVVEVRFGQIQNFQDARDNSCAAEIIKSASEGLLMAWAIVPLLIPFANPYNRNDSIGLLTILGISTATGAAIGAANCLQNTSENKKVLNDGTALEAMIKTKPLKFPTSFVIKREEEIIKRGNSKISQTCLTIYSPKNFSYLKNQNVKVCGASQALERFNPGDDITLKVIPDNQETPSRVQ